MNKLIKSIIIFLVILMVSCPLFAVTYMDADNYSQHIISVDMVINDVVYAGFSSKKITSFKPVTEEIDANNIPLFKESGDTYVTTAFYAYGVASSNSTVTISVDYGARSKIPGNTNKGKMYSSPKENEPIPDVKELPVILLGRDVTIDSPGHAANTLPISFVVNPKPSEQTKPDSGQNQDNIAPVAETIGNVVPSTVPSNVVCSDMLWFQVDKKDVNQTGVAGTYRVELELKLVVT